MQDTTTGSGATHPGISTEDFLQALYGDLRGQALLINKRKPHPLPGKPDNAYWDTFRVLDPDKAARGALKLDAKSAEGEGIFHRVTTLSADWSADCGLSAPNCSSRGSCHGKHRGGAKEATASPGVFLDVDIQHAAGHVDQNKPASWDDFQEVLEAAGAPALSVLTASSAAGFYPGWLHPELTMIEDYAEYARVQKAIHYLITKWSEHLGHGSVDSTFDLARVLRVPGTRNRKPGYGPDYPLCRVILLDGPRYTLDELAGWVAGAEMPAGTRHSVAKSHPGEGVLFDSAPADVPMSRAQAAAEISRQLQVMASCSGEMDKNIGGAAKRIGRFVSAGAIDEARARERMAEAVARNTTSRPDFTMSNADWAAPIIERAFGEGMREGLDFEVEPRKAGRPKKEYGPKPEPEPGEVILGTQGEQAIWLRAHLGAGRLAGYFLRHGEIVHTIAEGEEGYIEPAEGADSNGSVMIRPATGDSIAGRIVHTYDCVDLRKDPETEQWIKVPGLFAPAAARTALAAPDLMPHLRPLAGVVETPVLRKDGSLIVEPGYDPASRTLLLPAKGLTVPEIPERPSEEDLRVAMELLDEMTAEFPWVTPADRLNYYALLLTPILRTFLDAPCKMFGIGAHQHGSGKTFLADAVRTIHGGVLRTSWSQEEAEIKKETMAILATTTGAVVQIDNVDRITKSGFLASMLTARGPLSERELGASRNLVAVNDRVWVLTGNNLQLAGDLVRRTITILIDPKRLNPEGRIFRIKNWPEWVRQRRGELLSALLIMVRSWVEAGRPAAPYRKPDSDSFEQWSAAVAGILAHAGVPGEFDNRSGERAAAENEGDGELASVLEGIWGRFGGEPWTVQQLFASEGAGLRRTPDYMPGCVVDKESKGENSMRLSMSRYVRNHIGRFVAARDGVPYVIRAAGHASGSGTRPMYRVECPNPRISDPFEA